MIAPPYESKSIWPAVWKLLRLRLSVAELVIGEIVILLRRRWSRRTTTGVFLTSGIASILVGLVTIFVPLQPGAVDMRHVVAFLARDDHAQWRYITLGFGDQLALLKKGAHQQVGHPAPAGRGGGAA